MDITNNTESDLASVPRNSRVDMELLRLAHNMAASGVAREIWCALVCEAHGLVSNLPKNGVDLLRAQLADIGKGVSQ